MFNPVKKSRIVLIIALCSLFFLTTPVFAEVRLDVNGRVYQPDHNPVLEEGITRVSLDVIENTLGCTVSLENESIIIQENQDLLTMTIGSNKALYNEEEIEMPVGPEIVDGQTYVPLRFILESFGSEVLWEGETKTVKVNYNETRNNMTALDILLQSSQKMNEAGSYKMVVNAKYDMDVTMEQEGKEPENMLIKSDSQIEGWVQMEPILMYLKQMTTVNMPEAPQPGTQELEMEMLLNEEGMYMTMPEIGWVKLDFMGSDLQDLLQQSMTEDPAATMQQMKDMAMSVSFANDQEVEGAKYWVVKARLGNDALESDYYTQILEKLPVMDNDQQLKELMDSLLIDMSYLTWINQETLFNDYMEVNGAIRMKMDIPATGENAGGNMFMAMNMDADYALSDYGQSFTIPDVSQAISWEDMMPSVTEPIEEPAEEVTEEVTEDPVE
ncbi:MAG: stalk domain-containing protein [Syntrophomonadaceae bacterium]